MMMMSGEQLRVKTEVVVVENLIRSLSIIKAVIRLSKRGLDNGCVSRNPLCIFSFLIP